jgi:hypothetical protein
VKSSSASGKLPETGVAEFDRLVAGTARYARWVAKLADRGYLVTEESLPKSEAAEIVRSIVTIDPSKFRYIDLLHESRHIRQIELALRQGIDPFGGGHFARVVRAWFERGAYEYEQKLSAKFSFSDEYSNFLEQQTNHYWKRTHRKEFRFRQALRNRLNRIWR